VSVAQEFELRVRTPFRLSVAGRELEVPVLLEEFGAERGMLLLEDWSAISRCAEELVALGFGFSCLVNPAPGGYDDAGLADMLSDWGWCGSRVLPERVADLLRRHDGGDAPPPGQGR